MNTMGDHIKGIQTASCRQIVFPLTCDSYIYTKRPSMYGRSVENKQDKGEGGVRKGRVGDMEEMLTMPYICIKLTF